MWTSEKEKEQEKRERERERDGTGETKRERARAEGYKITADMYTYRASSTGLTGVIPTWVQEGGHRAWINRIKKPEVRERLFLDIRKELDQQPPDGILMVGFNKASMSRKYLGKTVAEAAKIIENAQRDLNIAFMNELALIFDKLSIDQ